MVGFLNRLFIKWLTKDRPPLKFPLSDFERIRYELRPCDVLLIEGRSRIGDVIKAITQSSWSHAALYIGRIHDIEDIEYRKKAQQFFSGSPDTQLVIESFIGKGTIISPLSEYSKDHIRICRPRGLSPKDSQKVINYTIDKLGSLYDVRHVLDLARFLLPWGILPRRWRSRLFTHNPSDNTKAVCSTIIAEAFTEVGFPILPYVKPHKEKGIEFIKRNPKLFTPRDFDYSPYFEIIKYPFIGVEEHPYKKLPWKEGVLSNDDEHLTFINPQKTNEKNNDNKENLKNGIKNNKDNLNDKNNTLK